MSLPDGYTLLARGARRAGVRDDLVTALGVWLMTAALEPPPGAIAVEGGGRGGAFRVRLPGAPAAVLRLGRRGGLLGRMVTQTYLGLRARPWRELAVTAAARQRGAPVAEVLAVCVDGRLVYRSAVVTAEVSAARTAIDALRAAGSESERRQIATQAGTAIARLHEAGVIHADLNLSNILVPDVTEGPTSREAVVIDLDRARIGRGAVALAGRRRNLARLERSARKLDPAGEVTGADVVRAFHQGYGSTGEAPCAS